MVKRKKVKKKAKSSNKPIGFTKVKKKYVLVYGTKTKPRLGKKKFSSKASMMKSV